MFSFPSTVLREDRDRLVATGISQPDLVCDPDDGDDIDDDYDERDSTISHT